MMVKAKPCASATPTMPPSLTPASAPAPAPINVNVKVPISSARLGFIKPFIITPKTRAR